MKTLEPQVATVYYSCPCGGEICEPQSGSQSFDVGFTIPDTGTCNDCDVEYKLSKKVEWCKL